METVAETVETAVETAVETVVETAVETVETAAETLVETVETAAETVAITMRSYTPDGAAKTTEAVVQWAPLGTVGTVAHQPEQRQLASVLPLRLDAPGQPELLPRRRLGEVPTAAWRLRAPN